MALASTFTATLPPPRDNQFLFLDMNSFFASCEQHRRPELRGKPVGVTPTLAPSGCIIAASYEAKRQGVGTGTRVKDAQTKIPSIYIVDADPKYYVSIHDKIVSFLRQEIHPAPLIMSVDEFGIPLDKTEQWTPNAHRLALHIKQRMQEMFSEALSCSIGIGPNMFLAKLGTEIHKPNGLAILQCHNLSQAYTQLKLRDIPGINWGMSYQLHSKGIRSALEFYNASRQFLHDGFGILGEAWWYNLHGYKVSYAPTPTKSVSHSHVLSPLYRNKTKGRAVLYKLFLKVIERLREKGLATKEITVVVKAAYVKPERNPVYRDRADRWIYTLKVRPSQNPLSLFGAIAKAYDKEIPVNFQPVQIYVVACHLAPYQDNMLALFPEDSPKVGSLFGAVDNLNYRYGRWTIKPASLLPIQDSAPNRITFRQPDFEMD